MNDTPPAFKFPRDVSLQRPLGKSCCDRNILYTISLQIHRMTNSQRLETVREHLRQWMIVNVTPDHSQADSGAQASDGDASGIESESILIRDGFYAGRTFEAQSSGNRFRATWFMEPDELKIHSDSGVVVGVFRGEEIGAVETPEEDSSDLIPITIPMPVAVSSTETDQETAAQDGVVDERMPKAA